MSAGLRGGPAPCPRRAGAVLKPVRVQVVGGVFAAGVGGDLFWAVNTTLSSDRAGLCSHWQRVTRALPNTPHRIAPSEESLR